jgi:hypothetical protein
VGNAKSIPPAIPWTVGKRKCINWIVMIRRIRIGMALLAVTQLLIGCSTVYNQKWRRAPKQTESHTGVVGRWEGSWLSSVNQHTGKLKCIVSETASEEYDFHYWARWSLFSWTYHLKLPIEETDAITTFSGTKNLGKLAGGAFEFDGRVEGNQFEASYDSKFDRGQFSMIRIRNSAD